ncbi:hypothetical protein IAT38_005401 [Cryptococcus sp. DSM 104549]
MHLRRSNQGRFHRLFLNQRIMCPLQTMRHLHSPLSPNKQRLRKPQLSRNLLPSSKAKSSDLMPRPPYWSLLVLISKLRLFALSYLTSLSSPTTFLGSRLQSPRCKRKRHRTTTMSSLITRQRILLQKITNS